MTEQPRRRALGRGLSALFGDDDEARAIEAPEPGQGAAADALRAQQVVPRDQLHPSRLQPRRRFDPDAMDTLIASIREQGIIQPILVRPHPDRPGEYEIVAGERRWRAAEKAGVTSVPIVLRELSDQDTLEIALIENIQRQDLSPLEEAEGYRRLIEEFGHTQEVLAKALGKSRSHVANMLRLLVLPEPVRALLGAGKLSAGHARALIGVPEPEKLAARIVANGLSVRAVEQAAARLKSPGKMVAPRVRAEKSGSAAAPAAEKDADTLALEADLSALLGASVTIEHQGAAGAVMIHYSSLEELDEVVQRLSAKA